MKRHAPAFFVYGALMIKKIGNEFCLYSKDGSKKLYCNARKDKVIQREKQIQRITHAKGESMNMAEEIWGAKYIKTLPATSFLHVDESGRSFPYRDESGKINNKNFLNSLAKLNTSNLSEEIKRKTIAKASRIAKESQVDLSESFLDEYNLIGPLFPPYLEKTLLEFNDGSLLNGADAECCDYYGEKLARVLNRWSTNGASEYFYDDDGHMIGSTSQGDNEHENEYEYQNGMVVRSRTRSSYNDDSETEYSMSSGNEEEFEFNT
jgi:hypothetical protein